MKQNMYFYDDKNSGLRRTLRRCVALKRINANKALNRKVDKENVSPVEKSLNISADCSDCNVRPCIQQQQRPKQSQQRQRQPKKQQRIHQLTTTTTERRKIYSVSVSEDCVNQTECGRQWSHIKPSRCDKSVLNSLHVDSDLDGKALPGLSQDNNTLPLYNNNWNILTANACDLSRHTRHCFERERSRCSLQKTVSPVAVRQQDTEIQLTPILGRALQSCCYSSSAFAGSNSADSPHALHEFVCDGITASENKASLEDISIILSEFLSAEYLHAQISETGLEGALHRTEEGGFCSTFSYPLHSTAIEPYSDDSTSIDFDVSDQYLYNEQIQTSLRPLSGSANERLKQTCKCEYDQIRLKNDCCLQNNKNTSYLPCRSIQLNKPCIASNQFYNKNNEAVDCLCERSWSNSASRDMDDASTMSGTDNLRNMHSCDNSYYPLPSSFSLGIKRPYLTDSRRLHRRLRRQVANTRLDSCRTISNSSQLDHSAMIEHQQLRIPAESLKTESFDLDEFSSISDCFESSRSTLFSTPPTRQRRRRKPVAVAAATTTSNSSCSNASFSKLFDQQNSCTMISIDVDAAGSPIFSEGSGIIISPLSSATALPITVNDQSERRSFSSVDNYLKTERSSSLCSSSSSLCSRADDNKIIKPNCIHQVEPKSQNRENQNNCNVCRLENVIPTPASECTTLVRTSESVQSLIHGSNLCCRMAEYSEISLFPSDIDCKSLDQRSHLLIGASRHSQVYGMDRCDCGSWSCSQEKDSTSHSAACTGRSVCDQRTSNKKRLRRQAATGDIILVCRRKVLMKKLQYFRRALRGSGHSSSTRLTTFGQL